MIRLLSFCALVLGLSACPSPVIPEVDSGIPEGKPVAAISPAALDFPQAPCGAPATKDVTVSNTGDAALTVTASTGTSSTFSVSPASASVAAGASAHFTVTATVAAT